MTWPSLVGGRVVGVWEPNDGVPQTTLFDDVDEVPTDALAAEVDRVAAVLSKLSG